jgi:hypothetical protein
MTRKMNDIPATQAAQSSEYYQTNSDASPSAVPSGASLRKERGAIAAQVSPL